MGKRPKGPIHVSKRVLSKVVEIIYSSFVSYCHHIEDSEDDSSDPNNPIVDDEKEVFEKNITNKIRRATNYNNNRSGHNLKAARLYPTDYESETERKLRVYKEKRNLDGKILNLEICSGNGNISSCVITHFPFEIPKEEFYISPINVNIHSKNFSPNYLF